MKVAINTQYGGFRLSQKAFIALLRKKGYDELCFYKQLISDDYKILDVKKITEEEYLTYEGLESDLAITHTDIGDEIWITGCFDLLNGQFISQYDFTENRVDKDLVEVIEELGEEASTNVSMLK